MNDILEEALRGEIEPSPFFAARVMRAVRSEAELPPIAFPAKRIAAAAMLLVVLLMAGAARNDDATAPRTPASHAGEGTSS